MLILSRKTNESIVIDGRIVIKVLRIDKDNVKLGIQAPPEVTVHRQEIQDLIDRGQANGAKAARRPLDSTSPTPTREEQPSPLRLTTPGSK